MAPLIVDAWNFTIRTGKLCPSHKVSFLKLIPKVGKDLKKLTNWRPITLSNCDHKMITKTYANRMSTVVARHIKERQTAYLKGRLINDNIRAIMSSINITNNEVNLDGLIVSLDAKKAFDPLTEVDFELDRIETNPRFAAIAQPANAGILVKLRIEMEDRGGRLELMLPYATLEPIRKLLLQNFMGEKFGRDNIWEGHLATELWSAPATLKVVLAEFQESLGRMKNLQVGDTLIMNATPDAKAQLMCGDIHLTHGQVGRIGHNVAMRVEAPITNSAKRRVLESR